MSHLGWGWYNKKYLIVYVLIIIIYNIEKSDSETIQQQRVRNQPIIRIRRIAAGSLENPGHTTYKLNEFESNQFHYPHVQQQQQQKWRYEHHERVKRGTDHSSRQQTSTNYHKIYSQDNMNIPHSRTRRTSSTSTNKIIKQYYTENTHQQHESNLKNNNWKSMNNLSPLINYPKFGTTLLSSSIQNIQLNPNNNYTNNNNNINKNNSSFSLSNPNHHPSVYVVSGLVNKYSILHLIPPTSNSQIHEIQNNIGVAVDNQQQQQQQQQQYFINKKNIDSSSSSSSGSGADKSGLAIILIEFDISEGDAVTYETIVETVD